MNNYALTVIEDWWWGVRGLRAITLLVYGQIDERKRKKTNWFKATFLPFFVCFCGFVDIQYLCTNSHPLQALGVLSSDTQKSLSVHNFNILFLHTPRINNAPLHSFLSRMKTELPCSAQSSSTIRDMSFPIPNPPLNCRGKLRLFSISTSERQRVRAPLRSLRF